jgi:hypothetical protein
VELIGAKPLKTKANNIKLIKTWVNTPNGEAKKYAAMTKDAIIQLCVIELGGKRCSYDDQSKEQLVTLLCQVSNTRMARMTKTIKSTIVSNAAMKPLSTKAKASTRIGLENEEPLLRSLLQESHVQEIFEPHAEGMRFKYLLVHEIYRIGMVKKRNKPYIKASIDALGVLRREDIKGMNTMANTLVGQQPGIIFGIELKTRTEHTTMQPEINAREQLQNGETFICIHYKE